MKILIFSIALFILYPILLSSCKKEPPTPTELYDKYSNGVVLIKHEYFYRADFNNGFSLCYAGNGDEFHLYIDEDVAMRNPSLSFATGFFIDSLGTIATNMHVLSPNHDEAMWDKLNRELSSLKMFYAEEAEKYKIYQNKALDLLNNYYLDYRQREYVLQIYRNLQDSINYATNLANTLHFNPDRTKLALMTVDIAVAYNNSRVNSTRDFNPCIFITKQKDVNAEIDLGLIQLREKKTPLNVAFFDINKNTSIQPKINDVVYMIGYNYGYDLAKTSKGIKSQLTQGYISQEPDENRLLYSIPTLQGSSGSPVIDQWGNLIGVNYAKLSGEQGFNFGIPVSYLQQLYRKFNYKVRE